MEQSAGTRIDSYPALQLLSEEIGSRLEEFPIEHPKPLTEWSEDNEGGWLALLEMIDKALIFWWNSEAPWVVEEYFASIALTALKERDELENRDLSVTQMTHIPAKLWLGLKEEADNLNMTIDEVIIKRLERRQYTWWQRLRVAIFGRCYLEKRLKPGWKGPLPFYIAKCKEHGYFEDYPHSWDEYLTCPECLLKDKGAVEAGK